jgi:hypothetical protein
MQGIVVSLCCVFYVSSLVSLVAGRSYVGMWTHLPPPPLVDERLRPAL